MTDDTPALSLMRRLSTALDALTLAEDDGLGILELNLVNVREVVHPVTVEYASELLDSGATECAGHVMRLYLKIVQRALGGEPGAAGDTAEVADLIHALSLELETMTTPAPSDADGPASRQGGKPEKDHQSPDPPYEELEANIRAARTTSARRSALDDLLAALDRYPPADERQRLRLLAVLQEERERRATDDPAIADVLTSLVLQRRCFQRLRTMAADSRS